MSPEPLRILHVSSGNLYGGVETVLLTLARSRHLCPAMDPHFALCFEGRLSRELAAANAPVHLVGPVRASRPWTVWRARRRLRELLGRESFDMVLCHMPWSLAVFGAAVRAHGAQLACWLHGAPSEGSWVDQWAWRTLPDLFIVNSHCTKAVIPAMLRNVRAEVMYSPVMLTGPAEAPQWRTAARGELAADSKVVIIQVSRLEAWKGHLLHLEALSLLKDLDNWVCWIVGGPQKPSEQAYFDQLQQTASRLGITDRLQFLGQRSDVERLLAAADIFCQPNLEPEPFGIVFIEALWAGCPVVSTAIGGATEIVTDACGLLTSPGNPEELAAALRRLIESPDVRTHLGKAGPPRARQLCDPAMQLRRLSDLCLSVTH